MRLLRCRVAYDTRAVGDWVAARYVPELWHEVERGPTVRVVPGQNEESAIDLDAVVAVRSASSDGVEILPVSEVMFSGGAKVWVLVPPSMLRQLWTGDT